MTLPVGRRAFLGGLLAAAAVPRRLFAAGPADFDERLAVFLSDIHVSGLDADPKTGKPLRTHPLTHLRQSVAEILKMTPLPRYVFVFGDLAYLQGRVEDYRRSYPELKLLVDAGINLTIGLGNHDHRKAFLEVWPEYEKRTRVPGSVLTVTSLPDFDLIMLDSLQEKEGANAWNPVGGALTKACQDWILANLPKWHRPFVLGAHHSPWELHFAKGKKRLSERIANFPLCRGFVHGHDHLWKTELVNWRDRRALPFLTLPSNGFWGDIGYVKFKSGTVDGRKTAVAQLVQKDFFLGEPVAAAERPAAWDLRLADNKARRCSFAL